MQSKKDEGKNLNMINFSNIYGKNYISDFGDAIMVIYFGEF